MTQTPEYHSMLDLPAVVDVAVAAVHANAVDHGWYDNDRSDGEHLALIHSEVSEVTEALRDGNPPDAKLPEYTSAEIELADAVIRIMDFAGARGYRLGAAILAKHTYNVTRPHKHGGKRF